MQRTTLAERLVAVSTIFACQSGAYVLSWLKFAACSKGVETSYGVLMERFVAAVEEDYADTDFLVRHSSKAGALCDYGAACMSRIAGCRAPSCFFCDILHAVCSHAYQLLFVAPAACHLE